MIDRETRHKSRANYGEALTAPRLLCGELAA